MEKDYVMIAWSVYNIFECVHRSSERTWEPHGVKFMFMNFDKFS